MAETTETSTVAPRSFTRKLLRIVALGVGGLVSLIMIAALGPFLWFWHFTDQRLKSQDAGDDRALMTYLHEPATAPPPVTKPEPFDWSTIATPPRDAMP